jgi:integrase
MKLTKASIAQISLPPGRADAIFFDDDLKGFGLRVRAGGKRTWIVQYRIGGQQRRMSLGTVHTLDPDRARREARERLAKVTLGGDPQADKLDLRSRAKLTLGNIIEQYLAIKSPKLRPSSFDDMQRYLRGHWKTLHRTPIHRIARRDVAARLGEIVKENGPIAAARARMALSGLLVWAIREGYIDPNPVSLTHRPDTERRSRDRVLSDAELAAVCGACQDDEYGRIVRLLILTGQRRDEVGAMAWSELDRDQGTWTIPGERTKNHRTHMIALPAAAWAIIDGVEQREGRDYLFGQVARGFTSWVKSKAALDKRMALAPWVIHDLRRTVATRLADLGVQPHVIETLINHVSGHKAGVAGIYNRSSYEREVRAALALWADHVRSIIEGDTRKIIALPRIS